MSDTSGSVLLIDDEEKYCRTFTEIIKRQVGVDIDWISREEQVLATLNRKGYDVVLLDLLFEGELRGFEILKKIRQIPSPPVVVVLTNISEVPSAVKAMKMGAYDYLEKTSELERVKVTVRNAIAASKTMSENIALRRTLDSEAPMIGNHPSIIKLKENILKIADSDYPVLITGETGTGKELVAKAIHRQGNRVSHPYLPLNCAAIPENLVESELFGHEKGAFSSADRKRDGAFVEAGNGILLLDEIGDMSLEIQAKLLRVLEERTVFRIGGHTPIKVPARIITATNKNLEELVRRGQFREDLLSRLDTLHLHVPPLCKRKEDIPSIFGYYMIKNYDSTGNEPPSYDNSILDFLMSYHWPRNVRELTRLTKRMSLYHTEETLTTDDLIQFMELDDPSQQKKPDLKSARQLAERDLLLSTLKECDWDIKQAAERMNMGISNLYKKIDKYDLWRDKGK